MIVEPQKIKHAQTTIIQHNKLRNGMKIKNKKLFNNQNFQKKKALKKIFKFDMKINKKKNKKKKKK